MFGIGDIISIGISKVDTPVDVITFHAVGAKILFLLCLLDMDDTKLLINNLSQTLIQCGNTS